MGLQFIDTHAHYNMPAFAEDLNDVLIAVRQAGVGKIICPAVSYESNAQMLSLLRDVPDMGFSLGIHPKRAFDRRALGRDLPPLATLKQLRARSLAKVGLLDALEAKVTALESMAKDDPRVLAIGEAGLDYSLGPRSYERSVQIALFELQVEAALRLGLPVVLHIRDAHEDGIAVLRRYKGAVRGVVHCFSAGPREAQEYLALGLHLGIGGYATHERFAGLREAVATAPADRLVLETDAPYVLPKGFGSIRNDSTAIPIIAREVAMLRGVGIDEVALTTTENAERLFFSGRTR